MNSKNNEDLNPTDLAMMTENECPLCGSEVQFLWTAASEESQITEKAYCTSCKIQTRDKVSPVH